MEKKIKQKVCIDNFKHCKNCFIIVFKLPLDCVLRSTNRWRSVLKQKTIFFSMKCQTT